MSDQDTLKSLQAIIRAKPYVYCEVGSYLGESLVPHLLDPLCRRVISIDPRPGSTPDERGLNFEYNATTQDMLDQLGGLVPQGVLGKLDTFEGTFQEYRFDEAPDLIFIDAEHTNTAVFRDALRAFEVLSDDGIIAFHDSNFVFDGLLNFAELATGHTAFLPDNVFVAVFGRPLKAVLSLPAHDPSVYLPRVRDELRRTIADSVLNPPNGAMWGPIRVR